MVKVNNKFWKNKKVIITGHTGFKGSWLSLILTSYGSKVYGYSLKPNNNQKLYKLFDIENIIERSEFGNILNHAKLFSFCNKIQPDIIIHLASQSLVMEAYNKPYNNFQSNITGTINLLNIADNLISLKLFLNVTTDKVYKIKNKLCSFKESDELYANDPYGISKVCSDLLTQSYNSFKKNKNLIFLTARSGNIIGGGDFSKNRLVPDILKAIITNKKLVVRNPSHIRPWQHIFEPITGYLMLIENFYHCKNINRKDYAWNFGPNLSSCVSVSHIVKIFHKFCQIKFEISNNSNNYVETKHLTLNSSKAKKYLHWKPTWSLNTAIENIIEWNNYNNQSRDIKKFSLTQFKQFLKY